MTLVGIDHVQLAMPAGGESEARRFYVGALNLAEVAKPANLVTRGGVWFALGTGQIHLSVDSDFRPAQKAHPAIRVVGLEALRQRLTRFGLRPTDDEPLPGYARFYVSDPFGNRLEFLEPKT